MSPGEVVGKRERKKMGDRRADSRDALWPGAGNEIWHRLHNKGFSTIPRLLSLITALMKDRSKQGDPTSVYLDLWCRVFDEGFIAIKDEGECAYASGYSGDRALRTWRERMEILESMGFIRAAPVGNRKFANILLVNPLQVVVNLRKKGKPPVPDEWWNAFTARADEIGADIPPPK